MAYNKQTIILQVQKNLQNKYNDIMETIPETTIIF